VLYEYITTLKSKKAALYVIVLAVPNARNAHISTNLQVASAGKRSDSG
jgi:hypothetical protein